jgi:5'(3')-deoxyribonucleotidase
MGLGNQHAMTDGKPLVWLDVDGVLADFVGGYLRLLEEHTGIIAKHEQITQFDLGASLGLTKEQSTRMKIAVSDAHRFARTLDVYPGALDGVRRLQEVANVWIATSPWNSNPTWTHDREWWLREHFGIPASRITHTAAKHLLRGDYLIDDKTETLNAWLAHGQTGAVQWETPHNRRDGWLGPATNNWGEIVERVAR